MDIALVNAQTKAAVENGQRVFQIHRFADGEHAHVARLERWAELPRNAKIIDMGSGTGEMARIFKEIRPDLDFTLVNISQFQLDYSPEEFRQHCCNFCDVPELDASFDAAVFCFSIGHADLADAMKESARLLKSGGVLFIYDMTVSDAPSAAPLRGIPQMDGNLLAYRELPGVDYTVYGRAAMEQAAAYAGLKLDFYMEPEDDGEYGRSVLGEAFGVFDGTKPAIWRFIKC